MSNLTNNSFGLLIANSNDFLISESVLRNASIEAMTAFASMLAPLRPTNKITVPGWVGLPPF